MISGAGIDLSAALADPGLLFLFIGLLIAVRGVSVAVSLRVNPETRMMEPQERFVTTAYCVMALPLVVATTQIVVDAGATQPGCRSLTAGAITVLVVPVLTSLVRVTAPAHPVHALSSIVSGEESANEALERQRRAMQTSRRRFEAARARRRRDLGRTLSSAECIARHGGDEPSDDSPATMARDCLS